MKLYHKLLIVLLVCSVSACKKKNSDPQKQPDNKPVKVQSVTESYNGNTDTYLLSYNSSNQLLTYQKQNSTERFNYTYEGNRINSITYQNDGKNYAMTLAYSPEGKVINGSFSGASGTAEPVTYDFTCTQNGNETLIKTYGDVFTLTILNDNLVSAEFYAWYYKRKIAFTYGNEPGIVYGKNVYLPNEELTNPFTPQSQILNVITQMALQVFSKNNLLGVYSSMYTRKFNYVKDANGNVVNSFTKIDRMDGDAITATSQKQISYSYK